jgi:hypothetical protein
MPSSPEPVASRNWVFTLNNPAPGEPDIRETIWKKSLKFLIAIPEIGESGTLHFQGYLELDNPRNLAWIKKRFPKAHLEKRRGSRKQAIAYCLKELTMDEDDLDANVLNKLPQTNGTPTILPVLYPHPNSSEGLNKELMRLKLSSMEDGQKKLTQKEGLQLMKKRVDEGASDLEIAHEMFWIWAKNYRAIAKYRALLETPRSCEPPNVFVLQGETGAGKSHWARENYPDAYWKSQRNIWFCGYEGHATCIIDEFYGWLPFDLVLRMCDKYPLRVEVKGGTKEFKATNIVFTTNKDPRLWYPSVGDMLWKAFVRRVSKWMIFENRDKIIETDDYEQACDAFIRD